MEQLASLVLFLLAVLGIAGAAAAGQNGGGFAAQNAARRTLARSSIAEDYYSKLVVTPSSLYGAVKKEEVLPAERWVDTLFNHTAFRDHLLQTHVLKKKLDTPAPMSYKCGVFANHHYKVLFIRNRKSASTTVLDPFKTACKSQDSRLCMRPLTNVDLQQLKISPEEVWKTYWVVTTIRNPFARAVSGYDYVLDRWQSREGVCKEVPFRKFCENPYHLGMLSNLFRCGRTGSFRQDDTWAYDFYHVEPVHHCLTGASGGLAVDFLIRYENLHEDFAAMVEAFNARRPAGLPAFNAPKLRWMKQGSHVQRAKELVVSGAGSGSSGITGRAAVGSGAIAPSIMEEVHKYVPGDRHAAKYRECGRPCVDGISKFYRVDLETFKFGMPTGPPPDE